MKTSQDKIGVYCLASDEVLEWFQAFVRSLRKHDPSLPLTVVPYNSSVTRLKALQASFSFKMMDEVAATRFDAIAHRVAGQRIAGGTFRKLSCFFGEYDTFLFLDSDIVVTRSVEPFLKACEKVACDFVYFDSDISMAYTPEFARKMAAEYGSPGFTSGTFIARRGTVTEMEIMAAVDSGEKIRDNFSIWGEQPFFNYLLDVTRRRKIPANMLVPGITDLPSAMDFSHDSKRDEYVDAKGRQIPFIHWAGSEYPTMVRPEVFLRHRTLGMGGWERMSYRLTFYYRRFRSNLKGVLLGSKWFKSLLERRGRRLRRLHQT